MGCNTSSLSASTIAAAAAMWLWPRRVFRCSGVAATWQQLLLMCYCRIPLLCMCTPPHRRRTPSFGLYAGSALDAQPPSVVGICHAGASVAESSSTGLSLPAGQNLKSPADAHTGATFPLLWAQPHPCFGCCCCSGLVAGAAATCLLQLVGGCIAAVAAFVLLLSTAVPCPVTNLGTMGSHAAHAHTTWGELLARTSWGVCRGCCTRRCVHISAPQSLAVGVNAGPWTLLVCVGVHKRGMPSV